MSLPPQNPYNQARWKKLRLLFLERNPLCAEHLRMTGETVAATVVDHIEPHRIEDLRTATHEQRRLFWNEENWQSMCKHCHDAHKQRLEKSGNVIGCDAQGIPLDAKHHWRK